MAERNLILIHRGPEYARDFDAIAERVSAIDPGITVHCIDHRATRAMPEEDWQRPTLTVALMAGFKAPIRRGPILKNRSINKTVQYRILVGAGLPSPPTQPFVLGMKLDPILFGEFVVIKPIDPKLGSYGRGVQLFRRRKLETMQIGDFPTDHHIRQDPRGFIVQRFIDIGPRIPIYRVLTLFGTPLYSWLAREKVPRQPLSGSDEEIEKLRITNNGNFRERFRCDDQDVFDLGRRTGLAFPDIPVLGMDILREEKSGKLFRAGVQPRRQHLALLVNIHGRHPPADGRRKPGRRKEGRTPRPPEDARPVRCARPRGRNPGREDPSAGRPERPGFH